MSHPAPKICWKPTGTQVHDSHLWKYLQWLLEQDYCPTPLKAFPIQSYDAQSVASNQALYAQLQTWSVLEPANFWNSLWQYFALGEKPAEKAMSEAPMPHTRWFPGAMLNYAEVVFRRASDSRPAILFKNEQDGVESISWKTLREQTAAMAAFLKKNGVEKGDRVAAFLPNTPHAIIAVLACMSIGAVWSSCSPDFGAASVADRFVQISPKVLIAVDGYQYNGKKHDKLPVLVELCAMLPSVEKIVLIPYLDPESPADSLPNAELWDAVMTTPQEGLTFEALPFDHPIWVLYSSGTTGVPKAITHSHGGNLLEHLKYLHFHNDVQEGERFFWFSTTGWMMWNFTLAALLAKSTIVLYDGSPGFPHLNALWELAEKTRITHFGTSAPFLVACMKAGLKPGREFDLSALRSIGSTGSPLPPEAYDYVYNEVGANIWLSSMAGGTDVCTAWVGGNPWLPVYLGEIQCICLGCAMEAWDENGQPVSQGEVGEMVVTKAMPSMPVFFWNDADGSKYQQSYFDYFPGVWRHGDWLRITSRGSIVILGRSDATLNRQGVRIGTAEIYRALDNIPAIKDCLIINTERPDGSDWMPLFVVLSEGQSLSDSLQQHIRNTLRTAYSPRHVPDEIIVVPDIPYTISGKKMETPVKRIFLHQPLEKAYNKDSMRNPESMDFYISMAKNK